MAKHTILFGCGHIADAELEGTPRQQKQKLQYLRICGRCPDCSGRPAEKPGEDQKPTV